MENEKVILELTKDEALFIEQELDCGCSILGNIIHQSLEDFLLSQKTDNEELKRLCLSRIEEIGRTQLITKSIRDKLEEIRLAGENAFIHQTSNDVKIETFK